MMMRQNRAATSFILILSPELINLKGNIMKNNKRAARGYTNSRLLSLSLLAGSFFSIQALILDKEQQSMLTPESVLQDLMEGNKRFCSGHKKHRASLAQLSHQASQQGQFPKAVILACMDSRSIPELVFDQSIADIFTLRVAGNVVSDDMVASIEYATKFVGAKLIVIMGHTKCGAIKAACSGAATGHIKALVANIKPAVAEVKEQNTDKQLDCADDATIKKIAIHNVHNMKARLIKDSAVVRDLIAQGSVKLVGALHDLDTGVVTFI
jgi:carbonic anhydrase